MLCKIWKALIRKEHIYTNACKQEVIYEQLLRIRPSGETGCSTDWIGDNVVSRCSCTLTTTSILTGKLDTMYYEWRLPSDIQEKTKIDIIIIGLRWMIVSIFIVLLGRGKWKDICIGISCRFSLIALKYNIRYSCVSNITDEVNWSMKGVASYFDTISQTD